MPLPAAIIDVELGSLTFGAAFRVVVTFEGRAVVVYEGAVPPTTVADRAARALMLTREPGSTYFLTVDGKVLRGTLDGDLTAELGVRRAGS